MDIYLDTEFNGFGGELISIALVPKLGSPFYMAQAIGEFEAYEPWVAEHVVPVLGTALRAPAVLRASFQAWVSQHHDPDIFCDWHADAEYFCGLLAGVDYGTSLDFACCIHVLKTPPDAYVSAIPHNALSDAMALKEWCEKR